MAKYRKRPIVIEAKQWMPIVTGSDVEAVEYPHDWGNIGSQTCNDCGCKLEEHGWIETREGGHIVCHGDWIIEGIEGEFYPCKPSIFGKTYEKVEEEG